MKDLNLRYKQMKALIDKVLPALLIFLITAFIGFVMQLVALFGRVDAVELRQTNYQMDHDALTTIKQRVENIDKNTAELKKYFEDYILRK
jgi:hypothetical protein